MSDVMSYATRAIPETIAVELSHDLDDEIPY